MNHIQHNVRTRILVHVGSGVLVSFGIAWLNQHRPHRVVCVVVRCHCRRARWPQKRRRERDGIRHCGRQVVGWAVAVVLV